ncbi:MAG: hypothetical protein J7K23_01680, partial [Thermoproteales archaeon]|nr:hypothetical protein [Thermoproteales archaeon]
MESIPKKVSIRKSIIFSLIAILLMLSFASFRTSAQESYVQFFDENPDLTELQKYVTVYSSFGSRYTGYKGYYEAVKFTLEKLNELKKEGTPISIEIPSFNTTIPYNNFSYIEIKGLGKKINAYSLYPNLVALGGTVNLTGKLIYVKDGSYQYINGKPIANNIILIDFNSGKKWLDLVALGAKAVIFIAPEDTTRIEAEKKVTLSPLDIPRLYVDKEAANILVEAANKGLTVSVTNICTWKQVEAYNIIVKYNGT